MPRAAPYIELTIGRHDGGLVSTYLYDHARPGMVVGLDSVGGDFVLPAQRPRRILFVSGGSGITPVMSMLRTLRAEGADREIAFIHYARTRDEACYADELSAMAGVRVLHGYTRGGGGELTGYFDAEHLAAAMPDPEAVYRVRSACARRRGACAPPQCQGGELRAACVHAFPPNPPAAVSNSPTADVESTTTAGRFSSRPRPRASHPESGCRMGICHSCTRRKTSGVVKNLITGVTSNTEAEDVQICVSVPVGDVDIAL